MAEAALRGSIFRMGALAYHLECAFNHHFSGLTGPSEDVYRSLVAEASAPKFAMPTYLECKERLREEVTDFVLEFLGHIYPTLVDAAWLGKWAMMWVITKPLRAMQLEESRRRYLDLISADTKEKIRNAAGACGIAPDAVDAWLMRVETQDDGEILMHVLQEAVEEVS